MEPTSAAFMLFMTIGEMKKEMDQNDLIALQGSIIEQQQEQIMKHENQMKDLNTMLIVLNAYIDQIETEAMQMREQIKTLDSNLQKLAASHSAVSARDKVETSRLQDNDEFLDKYIQRVENKTDYLEEMMRIHHP